MPAFCVYNGTATEITGIFARCDTDVKIVGEAFLQNNGLTPVWNSQHIYNLLFGDIPVSFGNQNFRWNGSTFVIGNTPVLEDEGTHLLATGNEALVEYKSSELLLFGGNPVSFGDQNFGWDGTTFLIGNVPMLEDTGTHVLVTHNETLAEYQYD
jgi:hypothetical protein